MLTESRAYVQSGLLCAAIIFPLGIVRAANPPRYVLSPGEQLIYKTTNISSGTEPNATSDQTTEITVLRLNPDGSWHLFEQDTTHAAAADGEKPATGPSTEATGPNTEEKVLDVFPDGHSPHADDTEDAGSAVFPSLPPNVLAMQSNWKTLTNPIQDQNYEVVQNNDKEFIESTHSSGLMDQVYLQNSSAKIHFDRAQGIVTAIDETDSGDYMHPSKNSASTRLLSVEKINAAALQQLSVDAARMSQAEKEFYDLWRQEHKEKRNGLKVAAQSKALLLAAANRVKTESIKTHLETLARESAEEAADDAEEDARQANFIGKPSPGWQVTDLDGHRHSLTDYRGKVLLLDFWFRGCEGCMEAMPQVKQLALKYQHKSVAILGLSMDGDPADVKFVGRIFDLPYPVMQGVEPLMVYGIHIFPTIVIIDQRGIVRDFDQGDDQASLEKKIDALLAAKPIIPRQRPHTITASE